MALTNCGKRSRSAVLLPSDQYYDIPTGRSLDQTLVWSKTSSQMTICTAALISAFVSHVNHVVIRLENKVRNPRPGTTWKI
ncbi:hypothetical protein N7526_005338 [Penicillium atrosanguineum]|nr:hypothetical protein N7526_005338 [Penicillium atrosanguineum]